MPCTWKPFLLTPLREGRRIVSDRGRRCHVPISTHAPAGGATIVNVKFGSGTQFLLTPLREGRRAASAILSWSSPFLLTPLREGRPRPQSTQCWRLYFYSRPCGRGDANHEDAYAEGNISTHAPAGGATVDTLQGSLTKLFLLTPLREGRRAVHRDPVHRPAFLLTPLREGRPQARDRRAEIFNISTHAPAGGATKSPYRLSLRSAISTHAPAGGATASPHGCIAAAPHFYSRPCGRGDLTRCCRAENLSLFLLTPLREGRRAPP